jgi:hypothetical protein
VFRGCTLGIPHNIQKSNWDVATQFLTQCFDKYLKKQKNRRRKTMKTQKKCILDIFTLFLAFLMSFQKNLNFKGLLNVFNL